MTAVDIVPAASLAALFGILFAADRVPWRWWWPWTLRAMLVQAGEDHIRVLGERRELQFALGRSEMRRRQLVAYIRKDGLDDVAPRLVPIITLDEHGMFDTRPIRAFRLRFEDIALAVDERTWRDMLRHLSCEDLVDHLVDKITGYLRSNARQAVAQVIARRTAA